MNGEAEVERLRDENEQLQAQVYDLQVALKRSRLREASDDH
jgi:hypothetical protein